jgi:RNA polymerase-binding transcription factor DksA
MCAALNSGAEPLSERALRLSRIDFAMDRLMNGQYGLCLTCGGPVEQKLLATDPALTRCYACRTGIENEHTIA